MTPPTLVNDIHSQLNPTWASGIAAPRSCEEICRMVQAARQARTAICVAGGRHSMGGQQFRTGALLCDMTGLNRVLHFDPAAGTVEVEAGMMWPELIAFLNDAQRGQSEPWAIAQKQTGANRLTLGGAVSA
ncbi:MAG: FAD-dependent oxidoreductase, partial [Armatimonadota bacterium]|nr:FAD-dependent oxidoreductase [Armatimonadota bacterium]